MQTANKYVAVENLGLIQRQAGTDPELADLVCACARLLSDEGRPWRFYDTSVTPTDTEDDFLSAWVGQKNPDADPRVRQFLQAYSRLLAVRRLPVLFSVGHLARKHKLSEQHLNWMAWNSRRNYREFTLPKSGGGVRTILAPEGKLLTLQRWILRHILDRRQPHRRAFAFVKGRSILDNVRGHIGRKVVIRLDLKDFFPSITHARVRKVFQGFGYPYRVAVTLANLCTVDGRLPQGAPTSPALSNLVFQRTDRRFAGLAKKMKFRYSRYADDLIFSSNKNNLPCLIPFFKQILREDGYEVNEGKVRVMRQGQRQEATGVVLNEKANLRREHVRRLRAAVHRLHTHGPEGVQLPSRKPGEHEPRFVLQGHLSFLNMINHGQGDALLNVIPPRH